MATARQAEDACRVANRDARHNSASHTADHPVAERLLLEEGIVYYCRSCVLQTRRPGIAAAQKAEHYEIATYGSLKEWAGNLGEDFAADILEEILEQEKAADATLTELARSRCNAAAHEQSDRAEAEAERRAA